MNRDLLEFVLKLSLIVKLKHPADGTHIVFVKVVALVNAPFDIKTMPNLFRRNAIPSRRIGYRCVSEG